MIERRKTERRTAANTSNYIHPKTPYRYYQNGVNVTLIVLNGWALPDSQRAHEVTCR